MKSRPKIGKTFHNVSFREWLVRGQLDRTQAAACRDAPRPGMPFPAAGKAVERQPAAGGPAQSEEKISHHLEPTPHDALIAALIREHGPARRPDLAPQLQTAERFFGQAHAIDDRVLMYQRIL
jgi:hypothetical protein